MGKGTHSISPPNVALAIEVIKLSFKIKIFELCLRGSVAENMGDPEMVFPHAATKFPVFSALLHSESVIATPSRDRIRFRERSRNL
jgi:hypothetical protein